MSTLEETAMPRRTRRWRPHSPDEPARQPDYRRLYTRLHELEMRYESTLTYLITRIQNNEKRIAQLEGKNHQ